MKSIVFDQILQVKDIPKPVFDGGESVVRVIQAGICNTDLEITKGYYGFKGVLGHEFVGVVESSQTPSLVGTRVVGEINVSCGNCDFCLVGLTRHCSCRTVLGIFGRDGAFREFLTLPEKNLHRIPESISDDAAVFVEPIAAACEIMDQVSFKSADKVAILGDGKLGLLVTMVLAQARKVNGLSEKVTLVGKHPKKMNLVQDLGVHLVERDSATALGKKFDLIIEATGSPEGWTLALSLLKPRGTLVLKSTFNNQMSFNTAPLVVDEITVIGSRCGRFEAAIELLEEKNLDPTPLLQHTLGLDEALKAFELAGHPEVLKVTLQIDACGKM